MYICAQQKVQFALLLHNIISHDYYTIELVTQLSWYEFLYSRLVLQLTWTSSLSLNSSVDQLNTCSTHCTCETDTTSKTFDTS